MQSQESIRCKLEFFSNLLRQIAANSGIEGAVTVEKVKADKRESFGLNAETGEFVDLIEAGVIDPTKVTRTALQNASSVAGLLLTTEALVSEIPEKKKEAVAAPGAPDMY